MQSFELSPDDVGVVVASLDNAVKGPGSGIAYVDGHLQVPNGVAAAVTTAVSSLVSLRKKDLIAYASFGRWSYETSGVTVSGMTIATDDRSKLMLQGVQAAAEADPTFTTPWVMKDGSISMINATAITALSNAVRDHVRNCFITFSSMVDDINNNSITSKEQIDALWG